MCHINIINDKSFSILVCSALRTDIGFSPKNDQLVLKEFVPICDFTGLFFLLSVGGFCSGFFGCRFLLENLHQALFSVHLKAFYLRQHGAEQHLP